MPATPTVATHQDPASERDSARVAPAVRAVVLVLALGSSAAAGWAISGASDVGPWLRSLFELYVDAQLNMLEASGNLNASGEAEYAVTLTRPLDERSVRALADAHPGVRYLRRTPFESAIVVAMTPGDREALLALRADPGVGVVIPNRGLWICH